MHLWRCTRYPPADIQRGLETLLDAGEVERMHRLVRPSDRQAFAAARGQLRRVLARYLREPPDALRIATAQHGKPYLVFDVAGGGAGDVGEGMGASRAIHFNLTHAGDWAVIALGAGGPVGVDVEPLRAVPDCLGMARDVFSPAELESLRGFAQADRSAAFLRGWTRKEAVVKALGTGMTLPLASFSVGLAEELEPRLEWHSVPAALSGGGATLHLHSFQPAPDYAGAYASLYSIEATSLFDVAD